MCTTERTQQLEANAIFFVNDMVSGIIQACGYRWQTPRMDFPLVRPEVPLYSFTPDLQRSTTLFLLLNQDALATRSHPLILQISNIEPQNRWSFIFRCFDNILNPYSEETMLSQVQWIATVYLFMVTSIYLCLFYYSSGQMDIVRDILIASEMIVRCNIMGATPTQRFAILQDYATQL